MRTFELIPVDSRKSFYGKAKVFEYEYDNTIRYDLMSYNITVCSYVNGEFIKLWNGYSATTARHIDSFRRVFNLSRMSKKEWLELPVRGYDYEDFRTY